MNKRYIVKEDEGIVIAIKNEFDSVLEELKKCASKKTYELLSDYVLWYNTKPILILENENFKGVSKCDEFDIFDEKKGKDIASCKADIKYHAAMRRKYSLIFELLRNAEKEIILLHNKHRQKECDTIEYLNRRYCREEGQYESSIIHNTLPTMHCVRKYVKG